MSTEPQSYFQPGEARAERVHQLFGRIAARYDLINDVQSFGLHRWWKRELVRLAQVQPGEKALDVCTGTGDLALRLHQAGAQVTGCDFSQPMLEEAKKREPRNIEWVRADALQLPFPPEAFDVVTIGYGLRNLADLPRGVEELLRVLKPGGRVLILEFGKPTNRLLRRLYFTYLRVFLPVFGRIFCGDAAAYAYILESLLHYPGQQETSALLGRSGCAPVELDEFLGGTMTLHRAKKL